MKRLLATVMVLAALGACKDGSMGGAPGVSTADPSVAAAIDASTPDLALKAYWRVRDEEASAFQQYVREFKTSSLGSRAVESLKALAIEGAFARESVTEAFSRDILEVKVETPSRAVALVQLRNVTPVPEGVAVDDYERRMREQGERAKYILTSDGKSWKVSEIWTQSVRDSQTFDKLLPRERTSVPTLIYGGL